MTDLTKAQLNTILSALDQQPRNPNTKDAALKAIGRHAEQMGLSVEDLLATAAGLLDGRLSPEVWRAQLDDRPEAALPDHPAEALPDDDTPEPTSDEPRPRRQREGTKQARMIDLLRRPEGATVAQIMHETGWLAHTCRGAMAGALKKKLGLTIISQKTEGHPRTYRIAE